MGKRIDCQWQLGFSDKKPSPSDKFIPATVPGAVQLDWAKVQNWPLPHYDNEPDRYLWMEDVTWTYKTKIPALHMGDDERLIFISKGIDYHFEIRLDGRLLLEQEGMFTPVEIDITGFPSNDSLLEIIIHPVPKSSPKQSNFQPNQSCKPAVGYGWDFHPRLIPSGIWDDTYLEIRPASHIKSFDFRYSLSDNFMNANINLDVLLTVQTKCSLEWKLFAPHGKLVIEQHNQSLAGKVSFKYTLGEPELWWPHGQGNQALYNLEIILLADNGKVLEKQTKRIGFRKVALVMAEGQWEDPSIWTIPIGPNKPPFTLEINGRPIFCKGSNWVSPDIFPGRITMETYQAQLGMAQKANFNLLRCWGGANVQKDSFFEICDELGIMVWQEFPLACNRYDGTEHYLKILDQESKSIIRKLLPHPSVVIWCGGNELFNSWSKMTEQDLAVRLLNRNCFDLDPERPFLNTSPVYGVGHGSYCFRWEERDIFQIFSGSKYTAYIEYGVPSPASLEILKKIIPDEELFPPAPGTMWELRKGFKAWDGSKNSWLQLIDIEHYFGKSGSLEELVEQGQFLQSEGLKFIMEEARRQKPYCSMALNWCFNEPWPNAANNCLISWPDQPKPALSSVTSACRPALGSARVKKFSWESDEVFESEIWLLNDLPNEIGPGKFEVWIDKGGTKIALEEWNHPGTKANTNLKGPAFKTKLPVWQSCRFRLIIHCQENPDLNSEYTFLFRGKES